MLISLKNIHKVYDLGETQAHILKGVSLEMKAGEFVAIMGPSGSGKSTLMHIIGLLDRLTSGHYILDNLDTSLLNDNDLAILRNQKIGFVFQAFHLLPRTSLLENVKLPLIYNSQVKLTNQEMLQKSQEALESVGLGHRLEHFSNQISGGEKQRAAIARALVNKPSLILADEPTGNLDSKSGDQVMKIFEDLNEKGNSIILVTHEENVAHYAKRIINVKDGLIVSDKKNGKRKRVKI